VSAKAKRLTLIACILGSVVVFVDGTIVQVALPKIRADLGVGLSDQQWIIDAYLLTLCSLLLVGGSLGDIYGRKRMFSLGVMGFGVTSLLCAAAPTATLLILARGLQGVTGALLVPATLGIITATFSDRERGKAIGTWTAWSGISTVIGPLAGGLILGTVSWRFIFAVNLVPRDELPDAGVVDRFTSLLTDLANQEGRDALMAQSLAGQIRVLRAYSVDPAGLAAIRGYFDQFWQQSLARFQSAASQPIQEET